MMNVVALPVKPAAPKNEPTTYFSLAETNKILRKHLARSFPGVKFRVKGQSYSGGSSTDVSWTDGPTTEQVEEITRAYSNRGFDGMIDMSYCKTSWLLPSGEIVTGYSSGTEGSAGIVEGYAIPKPHPEAKAVSTGIGYLFCSRTESPEFIAAVGAALERLSPEEWSAIVNRAPHWPDDYAARVAKITPAPKRNA